MGFWRNIWKFAKFVGKHAPEIIAVIQQARGDKEKTTGSK